MFYKSKSCYSTSSNTPSSSTSPSSPSKDSSPSSVPAPLIPSPSDSASDPDDIMKRVHQINEYYSQYVEEYYEEEPLDEREEERMECPPKPVASTLGELLCMLREARAVDIAVFSRSDLPYREGCNPDDRPPYVIVCSPLSGRHGKAVVAALSESAKISGGEGTRRVSKQGAGWYIVFVAEADTTIHVMQDDVREHFNLESLFSGEEDAGEMIEEQEEQSGVPDIPPPLPYTPSLKKINRRRD